MLVLKRPSVGSDFARQGGHFIPDGISIAKSVRYNIKILNNNQWPDRSDREQLIPTTPFSIRLPRAERGSLCGRDGVCFREPFAIPKGLSLQAFSEVDEAPVLSEYREFLKFS